MSRRKLRPCKSSYLFNINEDLGLLKLADTLLILINPSPSNVKVDTMYDLLNELVKQIATATEGNYQNSSILFKLPKQPKVNNTGKNFVKRCR